MCLEYLGLNKKLDAVAFEPRGGVMRNYRTGKAEMIVPFKELCQKRYGARYLHIHRADLLAVLEEEAKTQALYFISVIASAAANTAIMRLPSSPMTDQNIKAI